VVNTPNFYTRVTGRYNDAMPGLFAGQADPQQCYTPWCMDGPEAMYDGLPDSALGVGSCPSGGATFR
jgi:hypothetical protein